MCDGFFLFRNSNDNLMSTHFSKIIKTGNRQRAFSFKQLSNGTDFRYSVEVQDDKGKPTVFSMFKNAQGHWETAPQPLPIWIHNAEAVLSSAIKEHLQEQSV